MNSKKVISAVLLVSDGPVEHEYFEKLLTINNSELINLIDEINASHIYSIPGNYTIKLIVISKDNCSDTSNNTIDVNAGKELITRGLDSDQTVSAIKATQKMLNLI